MHTKLVDAFEVVVNSDLTEGRGLDHVCARFFVRAEAVRFAKGRDVSGTDGKVRATKILVVTDGSTETYFPIGAACKVYGTVLDKARSEALNKLTLEERKLLGLV